MPARLQRTHVPVARRGWTLLESRSMDARMRRAARVDHTTAETNVSVVEAHVLARRYRALRRVECDPIRAVRAVLDAARLIRLAITDLRLAMKWQCWNAGEPVDLGGSKPTRAQVFVALRDHERVRSKIFVDHVPRCLRAIGLAANAESGALSDGVVRKADMLATRTTFSVTNRSRRARYVAHEEVGETALTDEADTGAVLARVVV